MKTTQSGKKVMRPIYCALLLASGWVSQASAVTIDFDSTLPTYFTETAVYSEDGFTLTSNTESTIIDDDNLVRAALFAPGTGTDSQAMFWGANGSTSTISVSNDLGDIFDLLSLDVSSLFNGAGELTLTGLLSGGGSASQVLTLTSSLTTYNIVGLTNLVGLDISFDGSTYAAPYDLDNISVNIVPIPAAAWLFVSALGVLGWTRRKAS
jgi:hypothetical protein